jgi:hypothetical protein
LTKIKKKWLLDELIIQERGVAAQGVSTVDHYRLKAIIRCDRREFYIRILQHLPRPLPFSHNRLDQFPFVSRQIS